MGRQSHKAIERILKIGSMTGPEAKAFLLSEKRVEPEGGSAGSLKRAGSVSPEQWWTNHARLLAAKMKHGGVDSFRIWLNARGNYEFEVVPTGETLNDQAHPTAAEREVERKKDSEL